MYLEVLRFLIYIIDQAILERAAVQDISGFVVGKGRYIVLNKIIQFRCCRVRLTRFKQWLLCTGSTGELTAFLIDAVWVILLEKAPAGLGITIVVY